MKYHNEVFRFYIPGDLYLQDAVLNTISSFLEKLEARNDLKKAVETVKKTNKNLLAVYAILSLMERDKDYR